MRPERAGEDKGRLAIAYITKNCAGFGPAVTDSCSLRLDKWVGMG